MKRLSLLSNKLQLHLILCELSFANFEKFTLDEIDPFDGTSHEHAKDGCPESIFLSSYKREIKSAKYRGVYLNRTK